MSKDFPIAALFLLRILLRSRPQLAWMRRQLRQRVCCALSTRACFTSSACKTSPRRSAGCVEHRPAGLLCDDAHNSTASGVLVSELFVCRGFDRALPGTIGVGMMQRMAGNMMMSAPVPVTPFQLSHGVRLPASSMSLEVDLLGKTADVRVALAGWLRPRSLGVPRRCCWGNSGLAWVRPGRSPGQGPAMQLSPECCHPPGDLACSTARLSPAAAGRDRRARAGGPPARGAAQPRAEDGADRARGLPRREAQGGGARL